MFAIVSGPSEDLVFSGSGANSLFEVRPRRAGGLACVRTRAVSYTHLTLPTKRIV